MFGKIRAWLKIIAAILSLFYLLSRLIILTKIYGSNEARGFKYRRKYIRSAMAIFGLEIEYSGEIPKSNCLMVSNHRSMFDPVILLRDINAHVVSKAEVDNYPLIGRGARETGVIYVRREAKSSREASKEAIRSGLESGKSIMIFPEGTTSIAETTIDFKMGSFNVAAEVGVPVVPFVIDYEVQSDYWVNTSLLSHFLKVLRRRKIKGKIWIGPTLKSTDGRVLMKESRAWINEQIPKMYHRS